MPKAIVSISIGVGKGKADNLKTNHTFENAERKIGDICMNTTW